MREITAIKVKARIDEIRDWALRAEDQWTQDDDLGVASALCVVNKLAMEGVEEIVDNHGRKE